MIGSILANLGLGAVNNVMSEWHADQAFKRQKELMSMQNRMNNANAVNAYSQQVEGARMAGLNPAMLNGQQPAVQSVSQGSAPQGENVELNPQDMLLMAQVDNIKAQTNKTKEETEQVHKVNEITDTANDAAKATYLEHLDRQIADLTDQASKFKPGSKEYDSLMDRVDQLNASKEKVNDPAFVGALGIAQGMKSGAESVKADFDAVNGFLNGRLDKNVLLKKNMDPGIVDAIASMPKLQKEHLAQSIEQIKQAIAESESKEELNDKTVEKIQKEIESIGNEMLHRNLSDPVYIRTHYGVDSKEWKAWTDQQWRDNAFKVGTAVLQGVATGGAIGAANSMINSAMEHSKKGSGHVKEIKYPDTHEPPILDADGNRIKGTGATKSWTQYESSDEGVQQMFRQRR